MSWVAHRAQERGPDETRWRRGASAGASVGLVLQVWMLTAGSWNPLRWGRQSDFYEVQARALLDGTLAMDQRVLGIESFARGDQHYMYFGPVPALLRLPVVAVTRSFDGRLAAISMLCALVVIFVTVRWIGWNLRRRAVPGHQAVSLLETMAVGLVMLSVIGGSSLLYASARTAIYHEAILWGVALTLAAIAALLAWLDVDDVNAMRAHRLMLLTSVFTMLAMLTRPSVAGGALAALGLVAAKVVIDRLPRHRRESKTVSEAESQNGSQEGAGNDSGASLTTCSVLVSAVALPVVAYSIVNWLKFRSLFGVPFDQQAFTLLSEQRRAMLAANGGSLFNWKFVPNNLIAYVRPDSIGLDGTFPFLQPSRPAITIGSPVYDLIDLTAGIPTTMPLLVGLAVVGTWLVIRGRPAELRPLRAVLIGGALGTVAVLAIGYLANRYQSDFLPPLIVGAFVGVPVTTRWFQSLPQTAHLRRRLVAGGSVALLAVGLLTNLALGYSYQRAYGPSTHPDVVAEYIDHQRRVDGLLGDGQLSTVRVTDALSPRSSLGDVAIIGRCDALFLSDGGAPSDGRLSQWRLAELADALDGDVTLDEDADQPVTLVDLVFVDRTIAVRIDVDPARDVMTTVLVTTLVDGSVDEQRGPDLALRSNRPIGWQVFPDTELGRLEVFLDGRFAAFGDLPLGGAVEQTIIHDETGAVRAGTIGTPVCDRLIAAIAEPGTRHDGG